MGSRRENLGRLGSLIFRMGERSFQRAPIVLAEKRGARLGLFLSKLDRKHRARTITNLELAFPEKSESERSELATGMYRHFGIILADFLRSPHRSDEEVLANMEVDEESLRRMAEATSEGKGVLMITAHFGNWERFAHWTRARGHELAVVARDADDGELQQQVLRIREANGAKVLSRGNSAREILKLLKEGKYIGILPDQNAEECFVPFFGHPAGTVKGPAVLHQRTGAPILPCFCARVGVGRYRIFTLDIIRGDEGETAESIMARVNLAIETAVRRYPDQYLWMHNRWKSARERGLL